VNVIYQIINAAVIKMNVLWLFTIW